MFDPHTMAIRFSLDATYLKPTEDPFVNFSIVYDGPKTLSQLTCSSCQASLV